MCLGSIVRVVDISDGDGVARVGRLENGAVVPLSFVPDALPGSYVLVHLGIPVEVLDERAAREALMLRAGDTGVEEPS
jgi:hydrogenase expression/formation protein HypC